MTFSQTPHVAALFAGGISTLGHGGEHSGLRKRAIDRVVLTYEGVQGDQIVDLAHHGGSDKALCVFAQEYYAALQAQFCSPAEPLVAGGMGENLSSLGLLDVQICIGDVFRVGSALIQVSQPRRPCWKLNARFGQEAISRTLEKMRATGWYARVLESGAFVVGDQMVLVSREALTCALPEYWEVVLSDEPDLARLAQIAQIPTLAQEWREKLAARVKWLKEKKA